MLRCLIDSIPDIIFFKDTEGRYLGANPAFEEFVGRKEQDIVGRTDLDLMPPDEADAYRTRDRDVLTTNAPRRNEEWIAYPDGRRALLDTLKTPYVGPDGKVLGMIGVSREITHARAAEEQIAQARRNLETFFNTIDHFLFVLDENGCMQEVNQTVIRRLGYSADELRGRHVLLVHPPDRREEAGGIVAKMLSGTADYCPVPLQARDGTLIAVETRVTKGEWDGRPALFGISKDVTALRRSEEKFAKAFQAGAVLMAISTEQDGRFLDVNQAFLDTLGYTRDQVVGRTSGELGLFHRAEDRARGLQMLAKHGRARDIEVEIRTRDGAIRHGLFSADRVTVDDTQCLLTVMTDITTAKAAQAAMQHKLRFRALLNSLSRDLINPPASVDAGIQESLEGIGRFVGADRSYIFLFGEDPSTMRNTHEWCAEGIEPQIDHLQDLPCSVFPWTMERLSRGDTIAEPRVADMPETASSERDILRAQGIQSVLIAPLNLGRTLAGFIGFDAVRRETRWTDDEIELLRLAGDMIVNAIRRKKTEDGLRIAKEKAEAAERAQMMFLANMSHEIRTPLNAILGYAQILRQSQVAGGKSDLAMQTIMRSADHLLSIVNDLLALSRCEAGEVALNARLFHLPGMISAMIDMFRIKAAGLALALDLEPDAPRWMSADEPKVRQVIMNLLGNAVKFTETGSVRIRTGFEPVAESDGEGARSRLIRIDVTDTGCGIAAGDIPVIFGEFKQAAGGHNVLGGAGLGLALSRRYARLMGGDVVVAKSQPGVGSTFRFTFRATQPDRADLPADGEPAGMRRLAGEGPHPRLLVVDDDEPNRVMLQTMLANAGFEVLTARNGVEACRMAADWRPAGVLMDKKMPGMDGIEAMHRIKRELGPNIPVLIVTASGFKDAHINALKSGADGFVAKPIAGDRLFSELRRVMKVEFEDRPRSEADVRAAEPAPAGPEDLKKLPAPGRTAMLQAIRRGDIAELRRQIDLIQPALPREARTLRALAARFAYDQLERVLGTDEPTAP